MQRVLLQLNVPPYLKKILEVKYGNDYRPKQTELLGIAVINTLKKKSDRDYNYIRQKADPQNSRFKKKNEAFIVSLSVDKASRKGFVVDQKRANQIVRALDRNIREDLYTNAIINQHKFEIEFQTTIENFLDLYDISEEELSYESIRKDFNRNKKRIAEKLKIPV